MTLGLPCRARLLGLHAVGIVVDFFVCLLASATLVVASRVLAPASAVLAPCRPASYKLPFRRVSGRICMLQAKLCRWTQKPHDSTQFGHRSALTYTWRVALCFLAVLLLRELMTLCSVMPRFQQYLRVLADLVRLQHNVTVAAVPAVPRCTCLFRAASRGHISRVFCVC